MPEYMFGFLKGREILFSELILSIIPFSPNVLFLYPLETLENLGLNEIKAQSSKVVDRFDRAGKVNIS